MKLVLNAATPSRRVLQLCACVSGLTVFASLLYLYSPIHSRLGFHGHLGTLNDGVTAHIHAQALAHPIDDLIQRANEGFDAFLSKETKDLPSAAAAYRQRRNRHPPPLFDKWWSYAKKHRAVMIEDLFDQIYHDLEPFLALPPKKIRDAAASWQYVLSIRNGALTERKDPRYWMNTWHDMFLQIERHLPDVDIAFNVLDEPRVLVPWETINDYVGRVQSQGSIMLNGTLPDVATFSSLHPYTRPSYDHPWTGDAHYWTLFKEACPPTTDARTTEPVWDYSAAPDFPLSWPNGSHEGYVQNWTFAKDPCMHPHLRGLHGTFIEPISLSTTTKLFPIFGGSKLPLNNDILLPAAKYWTDEVRFDGGGDRAGDWSRRKSAVMWRGVASGGRNKQENWRHFHRHRFLSMLNGTQVRAAQQQALISMQLGPDNPSALEPLPQNPQNFPLPDPRRAYSVSAIAHASLPEWIDSFSDAAFVDLECFPRFSPSPGCPYTSPFYTTSKSVPMRTQYSYKYLPDIDGNSFSGRYRAFLRSHSLPIKATIYSEWHDSRLVAWKHFVPMDNTFVDFWGIMDYFLGFGGNGGHDDAAKKIAEEGRDWAERVLRKEDMLVYIYRLVLEYARVVDEGRERMGWVEDLKEAN